MKQHLYDRWPMAQVIPRRVPQDGEQPGLPIPRLLSGVAPRAEDSSLKDVLRIGVSYHPPCLGQQESSMFGDRCLELGGGDHEARRSPLSLRWARYRQTAACCLVTGSPSLLRAMWRAMARSEEGR